MRQLTLKRTKSFVGCLVKMKVYIEDPESQETVINKVSCRKLGELKNGEEKTFPIGEQAARVFVIADRISKNYCNAYYELPEGQEPVFLSGKNEFDPASGNAFRFAYYNGGEIPKRRRTGAPKGLIVWAAAIIAGAVLGNLISAALFSAGTPEAKTFSSNGMTVVLTDAFKEMDIENHTVAYESNKVAVFALKEAFTLLEGFGDYTLEEYGELVLKNNNLTAQKLQTAEGLTYFTYKYTNPEINKTFQYYSFVYKSHDAFWLVQFAVLEQDSEAYAQQIMDWAKTVEFPAAQ